MLGQKFEICKVHLHRWFHFVQLNNACKKKFAWMQIKNSNNINADTGVKLIAEMRISLMGQIFKCCLY